MSAEAWVIGLHLLSMHAQPTDGWETEYRTSTPGVYVKAPVGVLGGDVTAGIFRNSIGRTSVYLGQTWTTADGRWSLLVGGVTGYERREWVGKNESCERHGRHIDDGQWCQVSSGQGRSRIQPMLVPSYAAPAMWGMTPRISVALSGVPALHLSLEESFK